MFQGELLIPVLMLQSCSPSTGKVDGLGGKAQYILCRIGKKEKCRADEELANTTHTEWPVGVAQRVSTEGSHLDLSISNRHRLGFFFHLQFGLLTTTKALRWKSMSIKGQ